MSNKKLKTIKSVKGTRDFYPEEMAFRNWLFSIWKKTAENFGYQEYDGPILESYELFALKSGEELVQKQMYILKDKAGRKLGIRPEMTPTLARMVAQKINELPKPIRWYSIPQCWRYEAPQSGRLREHYQWNIDIFGIESMIADAEIITIGIQALLAMGLTKKEFFVRINNRYFMEEQFEKIGIKPTFYLKTLQAIDKKERLKEKEFENWLTEIGLSKKQREAIKRLTEAKDFRKIPTEGKGYQQLADLFDCLKIFRVDEFCQFDLLMARGMLYYTGTVVECFDRKKELRSVFGGGRYDSLVEDLGGDQLPGVGIGFGDVVIKELLAKSNKLAQLNPCKTKVLVTVLSPKYLEKSIEIATVIRSSITVNTELYLDPQAKLDKQLKYADRKGIPFVIILGPEEIEKKTVTFKDMRKKTQKQIPLDKLPKELNSC